MLGQTQPPQRVLIVNAGGSLDSLRFEDVTVVEAKPGLPHQRNVGLKHVRSALVTFLDDDVELAPRYLERTRAWFELHLGCVGASGYIENDAPYSLQARLFRRCFALGTGDGRLRGSGDAIYLYRPERTMEVDFVSGSNMTWRSSLISDLRFDEHLSGYAYMEDVDFSLRAGRRGKLWMLSDARLVHHKTTTSRVLPRAYVRQVFANGAYLFAKHRGQHGLRWSAYARRVIGRALGYTGTAVVRRSWEPLIGVAQGFKEIPRMLAQGLQRRD